jgi:hypothetical protein
MTWANDDAQIRERHTGGGAARERAHRAKRGGGRERAEHFEEGISSFDSMD